MATVELYHYYETDRTTRMIVVLFAGQKQPLDDLGDAEVFTEWVLYPDGTCDLGPRHFTCLPGRDPHTSQLWPPARAHSCGQV